MPTKAELQVKLTEAVDAIRVLQEAPVANGDFPLKEDDSIQMRLWWIREQRAYIAKAQLEGSDAAYDSAV